MKNFSKISAIAITALFLANNCIFAQVNGNTNFVAQNKLTGFRGANMIVADIQSQRIPAGTSMKIRLDSPVNTHNSIKGDQFSATLIEDVKVANSLILPSGTMIRGKVGNVRDHRLMKRSGELTLNFDHLVTPVGRQVPVNARLINYKNINKLGAISSGGYVEVLGKNLNLGVDVTSHIASYGLKESISLIKSCGNRNNTGRSCTPGWAALTMVPAVLITPVAAAGGIVAGGTVTAGKSFVDLFRKGETIKLNPGDVFEISLNEALDIPVN